MLHTAGFDEQGLRVVDLWESAEHFQKFVDEKLMDATQRAGLTTQPQVEMFPAEYLDPLKFTPK